MKDLQDLPSFHHFFTCTVGNQFPMLFMLHHQQAQFCMCTTARVDAVSCRIDVTHTGQNTHFLQKNRPINTANPFQLCYSDFT